MHTLATQSGSRSHIDKGQDQPVGPGGVAVIGAGPAGLTAAYLLAKAGHRAVVLEADDVVGGISRTVVADGYRFDIGGHRFFTKVAAVEDLWRELLPERDLLTRPRLSRIYYRGRFFDYPLRPVNALVNLGPVEALRCVASYMSAKLRPSSASRSLEDYIVANYGYRLYGHFFRTYTEKVWGVPASQLSADWGAQRIRAMSLWSAVWEPLRARFGRRRKRSDQVTSLVEEFLYPRLGPGMLWERCAELVEAHGTTIQLGQRVVSIEHRDGYALSVTTRDGEGVTTTRPVDHVISSMPLPSLVRAMDPPAPTPVSDAADGLRHRDFLLIALVVPRERVPWEDNWIYVHEPGVKMMRVQNFRAWSPDLVRDDKNVLGLEYTVQEGDAWWSMTDDELVSRGTAELDSIGLVASRDVEAGYVVRMPKAYPIYDDGYRGRIDTIRRWLEENASNIHPVGRNGMHRYNNQDHSMVTAMLAVDNVVHGAGRDPWAVNVEEAYHEEVVGKTGESASGTGRGAPILPVRTIA